MPNFISTSTPTFIPRTTTTFATNHAWSFVSDFPVSPTQDRVTPIQDRDCFIKLVVTLEDLCPEAFPGGLSVKRDILQRLRTISTGQCDDPSWPSGLPNKYYQTWPYDRLGIKALSKLDIMPHILITRGLIWHRSACSSLWPALYSYFERALFVSFWRDNSVPLSLQALCE